MVMIKCGGGGMRSELAGLGLDDGVELMVARRGWARGGAEGDDVWVATMKRERWIEKNAKAALIRWQRAVEGLHGQESWAPWW